MKKTFLFALLLFGITSFAQDKMIAKNGKITFESLITAFEEVKAINNNVTCILNSKTGEIASLALIKGFRFKIALMEEHFNENYVESNKYPKATFRGKIENFDVTSLTSNNKDFIMKGKLELHGKTKEINTIAKIRKSENGIEIKSDFQVNASDFEIDIPSVVKSKVSNKINVKTEFVVK